MHRTMRSVTALGVVLILLSAPVNPDFENAVMQAVVE